MESRPIVVRPEYIAIAGDLAVGALLSQIAYWYQPAADGKTKLRVHRHGVAWIAKTRQEWMQETGLTLEQYKRAIRVLKAKGLVEVKVMFFGNRAIGHLRLLEENLHAALASTRTTDPVQTDDARGPKGTTRVE